MSTAEIVRHEVRGARTGLLIDDSIPDTGARAVFVAATMAGIPIIGSAQPPPETPVTLVLAATTGPGHWPATIACAGLLAKPTDEIGARFARLCVADEPVQPWLLKPSGISFVGADGIPQRLDVHAYPLELASGASTADDQSPLVAENETEVLEHLNGDHPELVESLAVTVLGEAPGKWCLVAVDPEGLDLCVHQRRRRLNFAAPAWTFQALRARLKSLLAAKCDRAATGVGGD